VRLNSGKLVTYRRQGPRACTPSLTGGAVRCRV